MKKCALITIVVVAVFFFNSCQKQQLSNYSLTPVAAYFPLQTGKYITYDLDSLTIGDFGETILHTYYQVKYYTDSAITDNQGRTAYRIIRYIRDTSTDPWVIDNTFMALNTGNTIEWVADNMRFVKLVEPIAKGYSWYGNQYINTSSDTLTEAAAYPLLDKWNYSYDSVNVSITLNGITVDSTIKVNENSDTTGFSFVNNPVNIPNDTITYVITYSAEKYAKGIGLVYRQFFYESLQRKSPPGDSHPHSGYIETDSYGITLTMIDHN